VLADGKKKKKKKKKNPNQKKKKKKKKTGTPPQHRSGPQNINFYIKKQVVNTK
jgi:hypothetical protein